MLVSLRYGVYITIVNIGASRGVLIEQDTEPVLNKTMKRIINGIMDGPGEGHAFLIGLGDGVAFTKTDWNMIGDWSKPDDIKGELHYYKIGLFVGRVFIIGFVTGMLDILI